MNFRYFIKLQYNGKNYHGWQIQPNAPTVQEELNTKLSILLNNDIQVVGAGRTDAGVHAKFFVAHFDSLFNLDSKLTHITTKLNSFLPQDIVIIRIFRVSGNAHARFTATSRTYNYFISTSKNVFRNDFLWNLHSKLDIEIMNKGAEELKKYTDFTSFSKLHTDVKTNNCKIESAYWLSEDNILTFSITADRFLRNMVRSIVGTLVLLGRHKINIPQFQEIIQKKKRSAAGESAPAQGLFLTHIAYPEGISE